MEKFLWLLVLLSFLFVAHASVELPGCDIPYNAPKLEDIVIVLKHGYRNSVLEARINLFFSSDAPLKLAWSYLGYTHRFPSKDNAWLRTTEERADNWYKFTLHDRVTKKMEYLHRFVRITLQVQYECNKARYFFNLAQLDTMLKNAIPLPGIKELPHRQTTVDDTGIHTLSVRENYQSDKPIEFGFNCDDFYVNRDGHLDGMDRAEPSPRTNFTASYVTEGDDVLGTCTFRLSEDVDSVLVGLGVDVKVPSVDLLIRVVVSTPLRRSKGYLPAVRVMTDEEQSYKGQDGVYKVMAAKNSAYLFCVYDAPQEVNFGFARISRSGKRLESLKPSSGKTPLPKFFTGRFQATRSSPLKEQDLFLCYVESLETGEVLASHRVEVVWPSSGEEQIGN